MRSKQLSLDRYDTDKIANGYLERYDPIFGPWVNKEIKLLEIGIFKGGSLLLWRDYFPLGIIAGIDMNTPKDFKPQERIYLFEGSQADTDFLTQITKKVAPEGFDIIIDDASHIGELTKITFWHLFENHLKPGGLYVIEDWGTGYWNDWPDGMSVKSNKLFIQRIWFRLLSWCNASKKVPFHCHSYGMVGFIKELVDEQGIHDLTRGRLHGEPKRGSKFESILVAPSIVFVKKVCRT